VIKRWFNEVFELSKKNWSDEFNTEPYVSAGVVSGFLQPVTGRLSNASGKLAGESAATFYTPISSKVEAGDRITGRDGRAWSAQFVQGEGIAGQGDHQEVTVELVR